MDKIERLNLEDVQENGLSVEWLNTLVDAANLILSMNVDGSSGLGLVRTTDGITLRNTAGPFATLAKNGASTIPALSGTTVGSGTVTLYCLSGTTLTSMGITVTAYNMTNGAVAANAYLQLKRVGGKWFVDVEAC